MRRSCARSPASVKSCSSSVKAGSARRASSTPFCAGRAGCASAWVAKGQCLEHAGGAEAYLPVLDALGRLARASGARTRRPPCSDGSRRRGWRRCRRSSRQRDSLQHETFGATPERMLREIAEALEALTADTPLVLFLDDLHWSDDATVDFVGLMARRAGPSRLLLVARLSSGRCRARATRAEDDEAGACGQGPVPGTCRSTFSRPRDAAALLDARFPGHRFPDRLAGAPSSANQRQSAVHDQSAGLSRGAGDDRAGRRAAGR